MIELSLCAVVFALFPFWLVTLNLPPSHEWGWASVFLAGTYALILVSNVRRSLGITSAGLPHRQWIQGTTGLVVGAVVAVLLVASAVDLIVPRGPQVYILALLVLIVAVAIQFLDFVAGARPREGDSADE